MREIKFRAWVGATKTMVDLKEVTPLALNIETDGLFIPFSDGIHLMQFTGLHDKHGKEIYEFDIIAIDGGALPFITQVYFAEGCFCVDMKGRKAELKYYIDMPFCETKIIGNIYENKEET